MKHYKIAVPFILAFALFLFLKSCKKEQEYQFLRSFSDSCIVVLERTTLEDLANEISVDSIFRDAIDSTLVFFNLMLGDSVLSDSTIAHAFISELYPAESGLRKPYSPAI